MLKARIKFVKTGSMRFLGHLDVMRYFQKAIRRCEADIMYSTGFSPHQLISFASPLGLGLTSEGEYMDAQFATVDSEAEMVERFNRVMNDEIRITDFVLVRDDAHPTMSRVAASDYLIYAKKQQVSELFSTEEERKTRFLEFLSGEQILVEKKTKMKTVSMDIRPFIYQAGYQTAGGMEVLYDSVNGQPAMPRPEAAFTVETEYPEASMETLPFIPHIFLRLGCGSVVNIKPELVMEAFHAFCGFSYDRLSWCTHRVELYADELENTKESLEERQVRKKKFVPLIEDER